MLPMARILGWVVSNVSAAAIHQSPKRGIDPTPPRSMSLVRDGTRGRDIHFIPPSSSPRSRQPVGTRSSDLPERAGGTPPSPVHSFRGHPSGWPPSQSVGTLMTISFGSVMCCTAKCGPSRVLPLSLTPP